LAVDLLGYGHSPKPWTHYDVDTHITAIHDTLQQLGHDKYHVAGLSMGSILAAAYAAKYPQSVSKLSLVGLPYFRTQAEARTALMGSFWCRLTLRKPYLARIFIPLAWGLSRRSSRIRRLIRPKLYTEAIIREVALGRYRSFASSMKHCLIESDVDTYFNQISIPIQLIQGADDAWTPAGRITELVTNYHHQINLHIIHSQPHNIAIAAGEDVARLLRAS